jgi:catechol 2,3-dioxygenase-like lactoylglutathione lyase family enzyme
MLDHIFLSVCDTTRSAAFYTAAYAAALAAGAPEIHPPGPQLHYDPRYYAAQARDPDGYSLEFVYKSWQHGS